MDGETEERRGWFRYIHIRTLFTTVRIMATVASEELNGAKRERKMRDREREREKERESQGSTRKRTVTNSATEVV